MGMADRNCQCISLIRRQAFMQSEYPFHHVLNLFFVRAATTDDRLFDHAWSILGDWKTSHDGGTDGGPASLAQLQCRGWIPGYENLFDGQLIGCVLSNQSRHPAVDLPQALTELLLVQPDATADQMPAANTVTDDDPVAGNPRAWIDPENALHAAEIC